MGFAKFLNTEFLTKNPKVSQVLSNYDSDVIDKKDGKFSKKEVSIFIKDSARPIFTRVFGENFLTKLLFKEMNYDKDDYISMEEIDTYLQKEFKLTLNDLIDKDTKTACKILDEAS